MVRLLLLISAAALVLGGCAGPRAGLAGNDTGGIIPWSPEARVIAPELAGEHCARYGKYAVKGAEVRGYGNYISFSCRPDRRSGRRY